jgi:hypothetical protein
MSLGLVERGWFSARLPHTPCFSPYPHGRSWGSQLLYIVLARSTLARPVNKPLTPIR